MKINKTKVMVTTLALAMGAALAGSISGSVAWYQYSTRASAQLAGTSAGTSRDLQVKNGVDGTYKQHIDLGSKNFRPASYAVVGGEPHFYEKPIYKTAAQPEVETNERQIPETDPAEYTVAYAEFSLYFKCVDDNGTQKQVAKDIYLSGFEIAAATGSADITSTVRVKIDGQNDFVLANAAEATATHGSLDLNGNDHADTDDITVDDLAGNEITYYAGTNTSTYTPSLSSAAMPTMTNPYQFTNNSNKALATTATTGDSDVVKVQVWIEGWQALDVPGADPAATSQIWDYSYIAQSFTLKLQFACEADYE